MKHKREGIRRDLVELWRKNVTIIMHELHITKIDLARMLDTSRQTITNLFNGKDYHMTGVWFIATMELMRDLIASELVDGSQDAVIAFEYYVEIANNFKEKGFH